jgi:capsular exopolysaccharide synthesis family protein
MTPYRNVPGAGGPGAPPGHEIDSDVLEPRRLLRVLLRRKWEILLVALLVLVPVAIATWLTDPMYRASALVQIDPEPVQVLPFREIDVPNLTPNFDMFMRSQEQVLRGPTLIQRVVERLESEPDGEALEAEAARLHLGYRVQRLENTQIFVLSYVASNPGVAAKVANIFADEYIKRHFDTRQATREKARQLLTRELESLEERVQASERELLAYAQSHNLPAKEGTNGLAPQKLADLGKQLSDAEAESFVAQARLEALLNASIEEFPERLVTPVISALVSRLTQLENELTVLRASFGENWPAVVQKRSELDLVREQLDREKTAVLNQAREQATLDRGAAEHRRRLVAGSMANQEKVVNTLEAASIQYNILRREVETNRKMYDGLLERLKQTSVTSGMDLGGFQVVEPARPPVTPDSPRVLWNLMLASILGLALGVCVALARDYWDTSVSTVEEVEQLTVVPVLGILPLSQASSSPRLLSRRRERARREGSTLALEAAGVDAPVLGQFSSDRVAAEAIRNVCASILLSRSGEPPRILMVTSSVLGEGKTTLAAALGGALADSGAKTLMVECDLRRPTFSKMFGVGSEGGLSLFLSGHVSPAPLVHATAHDNLFVVAAGPATPNPPALLNSDRLRTFLRDMTSSFRFVILDAPPVLPIADARVLAPMSEGVVLVVRAGWASKDLIRKVCWLLRGTGASVLGAVLNGADPRGAEGSNYRYYRDYYGH